MKSRVGALYSELNIWSKVALLQSTIFYVYRLFAALILVGFVSLSAQLNGLIVMTLGEICYLQVVKPYNVKYNWRRNQQKLEIGNQCAIFVIFYLKYAFTGVLDSEVEYYVGWVYIGAVLLLLTANIANLVPIAIQAVKKFRHKRETERIIKHNQKVLA